MEVIKVKLLFIISSFILVFFPVGVMANTLQPGLNINDEPGDEQEEDIESENDGQDEDDDADTSGEEEPSWTYPDNSNNNTYNDNNFNDFDNDYYNDENSYRVPVEEYIEPEPQPEPEPEPVIEEPIIEEPIIEEPIIQEPIIEEPVIEEPAETDDTRVVEVTTLAVEAFSISGDVTDEEGQGVSGVELTLTGDDIEAQSIESESDGSFLFEEVPAGQYEIEVNADEEYEIIEAPGEIEVTDRSKRGLSIQLTAAEAEPAEEEEAEPVKTDEEVLSEETGGLTSTDWTLITTGILLALISFFLVIFKKVRSN